MDCLIRVSLDMINIFKVNKEPFYRIYWVIEFINMSYIVVLFNDSNRVK